MPWVIMGAFLILWLVEERGLSTQVAPMVFGAMIVGTAISNIIGGVLGDWADKKNPKYGRTIVGQVSVVLGIPFTLFLFLKTENWDILPLTILSFVTALFISWLGRAPRSQ